jgi:hypothetical protein
MPGVRQSLRDWWRRLSAGRSRRQRASRAAAEEARLIVASGELGLRHAAELAHPGAERPERIRLEPSVTVRPPSLLRDALSYLASIVAAALLLAAFMLFVVPTG